MPSIKYDLVTPDMIREALGYKETNDGHTLTGQYIQCKEISDKLNELIHSRCLYCEYGDINCKCWNDE